MSKQKKKKKAAVTPGRPCKIEVVLLPKVFHVVPKRDPRKQLITEGRVKTLMFRRSMSAVEVRNVIIRGFVEFKLREWVYFNDKQSYNVSI